MLADDVDATPADAAAGVYMTGEFNSNALTLGAGWTVATVTNSLRAFGIFVKMVTARSATPTRPDRRLIQPPGRLRAPFFHSEIEMLSLHRDL